MSAQVPSCWIKPLGRAEARPLYKITTDTSKRYRDTKALWRIPIRPDEHRNCIEPEPSWQLGADQGLKHVPIAQGWKVS